LAKLMVKILGNGGSDGGERRTSQVRSGPPATCGQIAHKFGQQTYGASGGNCFSEATAACTARVCFLCSFSAVISRLSRDWASANRARTASASASGSIIVGESAGGLTSPLPACRSLVVGFGMGAVSFWLLPLGGGTAGTLTVVRGALTGVGAAASPSGIQTKVRVASRQARGTSGRTTA